MIALRHLEFSVNGRETLSLQSACQAEARKGQHHGEQGRFDYSPEGSGSEDANLWLPGDGPVLQRVRVTDSNHGSQGASFGH